MTQVFLDKISKSAHIESVTCDKDIKNGQFLSLGVLSTTDGGEVRVATKANGNGTAEVILVDAPISYDDPHFDLAEYELRAGKAGRAYHLVKGDVISVTEDLLHGAEVGEHVDVNDDGFGFKKATGEGFAMVIGKENHGFDGTVYVIAIR
ncbi:hypothetical protein [Lactobacillus taiwanensis]|uniref:hypothetical protein n=1 Tax=Lactobacillus taiwanensis TaxID=508451 RepID=UPI00322064FC